MITLKLTDNQAEALRVALIHGWDDIYASDDDCCTKQESRDIKKMLNKVTTIQTKLDNLIEEDRVKQNVKRWDAIHKVSAKNISDAIKCGDIPSITLKT